MTKFLILILVIVIIVYLVVSSVLRFIARIFPGFVKVNLKQPKEKRTSSDNVVYKKDNVVVLKGEAGKKENSTEQN